MNKPRYTLRDPNRSLSTELGVTLLVAITVLLVSVTGAVFAGLAQDQAVHGTATYNFEHVEADDSLQIAAAGVKGRDSTFVMEINGYRTYEWDGTGTITVNCVYAGDKVEIFSEKGDSRFPVSEYRVKNPTNCKISALDEKIEYALIKTQEMSSPKKAKINKFGFTISIDPDGPGSDSTGGSAVHKKNIGTIPMTNEWHYIRRYDREIEGFEPPVWTIIMVDNVHWKSPGKFDPSSLAAYNWTDDPPGNPGASSYKINKGNFIPIPSGTEPTNDVYLVFKPGCDQSKVKLVDETAGYDNRLYLDGSVMFANTNKVSIPSTKTLSGVDCPTIP